MAWELRNKQTQPDGSHILMSRLNLLCGWCNMGYCTARPRACKETLWFQPHRSQRSSRRCWGWGNLIHVTPSRRPNCRYPHSTVVTSNYDSRWRGTPNPTTGPLLAVKQGGPTFSCVRHCLPTRILTPCPLYFAAITWSGCLTGDPPLKRFAPRQNIEWCTGFVSSLRSGMWITKEEPCLTPVLRNFILPHPIWVGRNSTSNWLLKYTLHN
jgi:hypothetical protein